MALVVLGLSGCGTDAAIGAAPPTGGGTGADTDTGGPSDDSSRARVIGGSADPIALAPELPFECISARRGSACCLPGQTLTTGTSGADVLVFHDETPRCLLGVAGADALETGSATDVHLGGDGNDTIRTGKGDDAALGGPGDDLIELFNSSPAEPYSNLAHGGVGDDVIVGAAGNDVLFGNEDDDDIEGNDGDDEIIGGPGADDVRGGNGKDTFVIGSACEISAGDTIDGGASTDTVRSPFSQAELQAMGATFASIEVFEAMLPNALGHGACYEDYHNKVRCECCEPGWGGARCRECIDPTLCGTPVSGPYAKPLRTKFFNDDIPEFTGGVYPTSVAVRQTVALPAALAVTGGGDGWYFDDRMAGNSTVIPEVLALGAWAEVGRDLVWTVGLHSDGAESIALELDKLSLPAGAELWVYSERALHGPVTSAELGTSDHTFVPPLPGDTVYLELLKPAGVAVTLKSINAGPIAHLAPDACFEDVACFPQAGPQAEGVGIIYRPNGYWCSGSLINANTTDAAFLTAEHCLAVDDEPYLEYLAGSPAGGTQVQAWMEDFDGSEYVQFRYRNTECGTPSEDAYSESLTYPVTGLLYHDHEADIGVVKLASPPDPACVTYNGFDARSSAPTPSYTVGIRHPAGRLAKIDIDDEPPGTSPYIDVDPEIMANFLEAAREPFWKRRLDGPQDIGWIEGGSSGGPVFDHHGRVVGQASGHIGNVDSCISNLVEFFDGRLGIAYDISANAFTGLDALLGSTRRDAPFESYSDPFPLSVNSDSLTPCIGGATYIVNPQVADQVHIEWDADGAPGQIIGQGYGYLSDFPDHFYWYSMDTVEVNPGGPEPPITVRITTDFGPSHPDCATTVREFVVQPTECI
jgi:hypothetical protein